MPDQHAKLSPSASERWLSCPASIRMEALVPPQTESVYAAEGTAAHALAELKASLAFGYIDRRTYIKRRDNWRGSFNITPDTEGEMEEHTDEYVRILQERAQLYPDTVVMLEQRLDTGVPTCWGTSDAVLVSPRHVEIVDFKYGSGVIVRAAGNPQLRLYACGALDQIADLLGEVETVRITVHQPRAGTGEPDTEEISPEDLRQWRDTHVLPVAQEALGEEARFGPSDEACRWCPASGRCKAQLEDVFSDPVLDAYQDPRLLTPDEVAEALSRVRHVQAWLTALEEASLAMAYSEGKSIPGYKVVLSRGKRYVADPEGVIRTLVDEGYSFDQVGKRSARGIGELEKLLGGAKFELLLDPYIRKSEGKPSLVPDKDKRASINPNDEAQKEFAS